MVVDQVPLKIIVRFHWYGPDHYIPYKSFAHQRINLSHSMLLIAFKYKI